jgi:hypothetical protein
MAMSLASGTRVDCHGDAYGWLTSHVARVRDGLWLVKVEKKTPREAAHGQATESRVAARLGIETIQSSSGMRKVIVKADPLSATRRLSFRNTFSLSLLFDEQYWVSLSMFASCQSFASGFASGVDAVMQQHDLFVRIEPLR